jgi:hypothetical protein
MTEENHDNHDDHIDRAQAHLASLKRDMRKTLEDAVVRAAHKVMAEFEAKSDERLMEDWGPGPHEVHSLPARGPEQKPVALPEKIYEFVPTPEPAKWHHPECEGECIACLIERVVQEAYGSQGLSYLQRHLTSSPAQQEPVGMTLDASAPLVMVPHPAFQQPAQQEPFGWVVEHKHGGKCFSQTMAGVYTDTAVKITTVYTSPQAREPLNERELMKCIAAAGCFGTVKMTCESGPYDIDRPTLNADKLCRAIEAAHGIGEKK